MNCYDRKFDWRFFWWMIMHVLPILMCSTTECPLPLVGALPWGSSLAGFCLSAFYRTSHIPYSQTQKTFQIKQSMNLRQESWTIIGYLCFEYANVSCVMWAHIDEDVLHIYCLSFPTAKDIQWQMSLQHGRGLNTIKYKSRRGWGDSWTLFWSWQLLILCPPPPPPSCETCPCRSVSSSNETDLPMSSETEIACLGRPFVVVVVLN